MATVEKEKNEVNPEKTVEMRKNLATVCVFALFILTVGTGCEAFKEAWEDATTYEDTPEEIAAEEEESSQKKYEVALHAIVKYPRATPNEQDIPTLDGKTIWIKKNQLFSSKNIKRVKAIPRPGNPDLYDLEIKVDRFGRLQWQLLSGNRAGEPVALIVDGVYFVSFYPEQPENDSTYWIFLRVGLDPVTARGIARNAKKNYEILNPGAFSLF